MSKNRALLSITSQDYPFSENTRGVTLRLLNGEYVVHHYYDEPGFPRVYTNGFYTRSQDLAKAEFNARASRFVDVSLEVLS